MARHSNGLPTSGIYLSRSLSTARRLVLLTPAGSQSEHSLDDVTYTLPSFVPASLAQRVVAAGSSSSGRPGAGAGEGGGGGGGGWDPSAPSVIEALQALRRLETAVEHETQLLVSRGANDLFRILHASSAAASSSSPSPSLPSNKGAKGAKKKGPAARAPAPGPAPASAPPRSITVSSALSALRLPLNTSSSSSSPARPLALHRLLLSSPTHFLADPLALRTSGRFDLRPADEVARFERVRAWTRERAGEIDRWADKCARVRGWAREWRAAAGGTDAPSSASGGGGGDALRRLALPRDDATFRWSAADLTLFAFLRDTLAAERLLQGQPHMAIAPLLLKAVDAASARMSSGGPAREEREEEQRQEEEGERSVRKEQVRALLSDVGVVAPWENWAAHERVTGLAAWDETGARVEKALAAGTGAGAGASKGGSKGGKKGTVVLPSGEFYPQDPHDAVRHDFGPRATVYTIDDIGASELDDGISLAPGPPSSRGGGGGGGGRTWWVHVHVADPTALLHPGHLLAKLARVRDHTEYFPEKTWAMLPEAFVVGQGMSLGARQRQGAGAEGEGEGEGQRVLSLGVRIDEETGEVLQSEVKAGIVRDVRRLTYGAVDRALGYTPPPKGRVVRSWHARDDDDETEAGADAGRGSAPQRPTDDARLETDAQAVSDLRTLHALAAKLLRQRVASSALFWQFPSASVSVSPKPLAPHFRTSPAPALYASAPRVALQLPSEAAIAGHASHADSPAQLLVSELMVAANRCAARFAVEHDLAAPFRTQCAPAVSDPAALEAVLALRDPRTGQAPALDVLRRRIDFLPGATTPSPGPHWPMGIDGEYGYLKVTSPLRRYSDLFAHYQLKGALLPASASSGFAPRASVAQVQAHIDGFAAAAKARHRLDSAASAFWALWVLQPHLARLSGSSSSSSSSTLSTHLHPAPEDPETLDLLAHNLTALALRPPTHSAVENVYVQPVLIPQLGLRGTLQVDRAAEGGEVGEEVRVRIAQCVVGPRSRVVCERR